MKYGFPVASGKRTSMRRPFGLEIQGMRIEAERLRAEYVSFIGVFETGYQALVAVGAGIGEGVAHAMNILLLLLCRTPRPDWTQLQPVIDDAMHLLNEQDREAVLLRHFENRSYAEIASDLGLTENAARMRVERALEKLRTVLTKRGMGSTLAVLAALLAANAVTAAPVGLSAKVVGASLAGAAAAGGASTFLPWLAASKPKLAATAAIVATVAVTTIAIRHAVSQTQKEIPTVLASRPRHHLRPLRPMVKASPQMLACPPPRCRRSTGRPCTFKSWMPAPAIPFR